LNIRFSTVLGVRDIGDAAAQSNNVSMQGSIDAYGENKLAFMVAMIVGVEERRENSSLEKHDDENIL
jgi:hypothetical protein